MQKRLSDVQEIIRHEGWGSLVVLDPSDIVWLSGLHSSNAALIVTTDRLIVATDFRYVAQAESLGLEVAKIEQAMWLDLGRIAGEATENGPIVYPPSALSHRSFLQFVDAVPEAVTVRAVDGVIARLRVLKDADEIKRIRRAADLLTGAYEMVVEQGLKGRREKDVAWMIEKHLRDAGAEGLSFASIVAGGPNGAFPHHSPGDDEIPNDTLVTIDIGCIVDDYCSDCTRTFAVGNPSDELREIYAITLHAQKTALGAIKPGCSGREIDAIAREIISDAGYGDFFGHGLGHGVGLEVHEAPRLSKTSEDTLAAGMIVTVEPGIYLPKKGGVRIEDLAVITEGGTDVLTPFTKELTFV